MGKFKMSDYNPIFIAIVILLFIAACAKLAQKPFSEVETGGGVVPPNLVSILVKEFPDEYEIIMAAAIRNQCEGDNIPILFAIRKAENGPPGNEFGVLVQAGTDLDTQAGWAAATIVKNRARWNAEKGFEGLFGEKGFIIFLGRKYCPPETDVEGHANWVRNVTYWTEKLNGASTVE